jgi:hypothetical protein
MRGGTAALAAGWPFDLTLTQFVRLPIQRGVGATPIDRRAVGVRLSYDF